MTTTTIERNSKCTSEELVYVKGDVFICIHPQHLSFSEQIRLQILERSTQHNDDFRTS